jgi:CheY-like chemotaxis protein
LLAAVDEVAPSQHTCLRLLYIEDNVPNVRVVEHVLRLRPGWQLIHAGTGQIGIDVARSQIPHLVLLDLHLPDLSGAHVLSALKNHPLTAGIPVVILTADASSTQPPQLLSAGAERFVTKPLDLDEILQVLDDIAARSRGGQEGKGAAGGG